MTVYLYTVIENVYKGSNEYLRNFMLHAVLQPVYMLFNNVVKFSRPTAGGAMISASLRKR